MNEFTCDGCWQTACERARRTDGDVAGWYRVYHDDAHKRQGLPETRVTDTWRTVQRLPLA